MNLIEINLMIIEIQLVENRELAVSVNNTLVHHTVFLAADTRLCALMYIDFQPMYYFICKIVVNSHAGFLR